MLKPPQMHLIGRAQSAWTERARWALDHHGIDYRYSEYRPVIDDLWLRVVARRPTGRVVLPVLRHGSQIIRGSFQAALHAEQEGTRARLVPDITTVIRWNALSDRLIVAGRGLAARRIAMSPEALAESIPARAPALSRLVLVPVVRAHLVRRVGLYGLDAASAQVLDGAVRADLAEVRAALAGRDYLIDDRFSYADIAVATALQTVRAPEGAAGGRGPATTACRTHEAIARDYDDVLAWRDRVRARHRRPAEGPRGPA